MTDNQVKEAIAIIEGIQFECQHGEARGISGESLRAMHTFLSTLNDTQESGGEVCDICGAELRERQDRYTDGEYARSQSFGCPNNCHQLSKSVIKRLNTQNPDRLSTNTDDTSDEVRRLRGILNENNALLNDIFAYRNEPDKLQCVVKKRIPLYAPDAVGFKPALSHRDDTIRRYREAIQEGIDRAESYGCSDWSIEPLVEAINPPEQSEET